MTEVDSRLEAYPATEFVEMLSFHELYRTWSVATRDNPHRLAYHFPGMLLHVSVRHYS